jgi:hypothetical protein
MVKHWRISHPELPTQPQFSIQVIGSYRDALSQQVGEAVRIDLRGEDVLNSKAELNRCSQSQEEGLGNGRGHVC